MKLGIYCFQERVLTKSRSHPLVCPLSQEELRHMMGARKKLYCFLSLSLFFPSPLHPLPYANHLFRPTYIPLSSFLVPFGQWTKHENIIPASTIFLPSGKLSQQKFNSTKCPNIGKSGCHRDIYGELYCIYILMSNIHFINLKKNFHVIFV